MEGGEGGDGEGCPQAWVGEYVGEARVDRESGEGVDEGGDEGGRGKSGGVWEGDATRGGGEEEP